MLSTEFLLKLLNRDNISRYIYTILFLSLITIFDFFALFILGKMVGIYLYLAVIASLSLFGVMIVIKLLKRTISRLEDKHDIGVFPENEFYKITGLFFCSFLIIFPGIISSFIGFILILPTFVQLIGRILTKSLKLDWYAVYEYKELYSN
ncbi:MAG: FxsA family protein [Spirochaetaceae bacterium]